MCVYIFRLLELKEYLEKIAMPLYLEAINDKFVKCCLHFMLWLDQNCDSGLTHMDSLLRYSMELIDCD